MFWAEVEDLTGWIVRLEPKEDHKLSYMEGYAYIIGKSLFPRDGWTGMFGISMKDVEYIMKPSEERIENFDKSIYDFHPIKYIGLEKTSSNPNLGKCYELNWKFVSEHPDYKLVHGYITSRQGNTLDHAWSENDTEVHDAVLDWDLPKEAYYGMFSAEKIKEYTYKEIMEKGLETKHYGPWHEIDREIKTTPRNKLSWIEKISFAQYIWIDPNGRVINLGNTSHTSYAESILKENYPELIRGRSDFVDILLREGWIRGSGDYFEINTLNNHIIDNLSNYIESLPEDDIIGIEFTGGTFPISLYEGETKDFVYNKDKILRGDYGKERYDGAGEEEDQSNNSESSNSRSIQEVEQNENGGVSSNTEKLGTISAAEINRIYVDVQQSYLPSSIPTFLNLPIYQKVQEFTEIFNQSTESIDIKLANLSFLLLTNKIFFVLDVMTVQRVVDTILGKLGYTLISPLRFFNLLTGLKSNLTEENKDIFIRGLERFIDRHIKSFSKLSWIEIDNLLINEAKKYKSADEFIKAQGAPVYHGSNQEFSEFNPLNIGQNYKGDWLDGFHFIGDFEKARGYAEYISLDWQTPHIIEAYLSIKKPYKLGHPRDEMIKRKVSTMKELSEQIKSEGYDSIIYKHDKNNDAIVVFSPDQIKTKSQLIDIWNSVHPEQIKHSWQEAEITSQNDNGIKARKGEIWSKTYRLSKSYMALTEDGRGRAFKLLWEAVKFLQTGKGYGEGDECVPVYLNCKYTYRFVTRVDDPFWNKTKLTSLNFV